MHQGAKNSLFRWNFVPLSHNIVQMKVGEIQTLQVGRVSDYGLYLVDDEQNEVLLPNRYVSLSQKVGDEVSVFVYHDSEDRIVATTETPLITAGKVAWLKVVDKNIHGAFLDWGVSGKDLFLPNRNQQGGIVIGISYPVYLYVVEVTGRCVASNKLRAVVNNDDIVTVGPRQEVDALVVSESPIGYRVVVENRHWGMLYKNQIFRPLALGERCRAYVVRVTDERRIDLSLQRQGYAQVKDSAETLYEAIVAAGGSLPLNDASAPEEVQRTLGMSKKLFKRSLGVLLSHNRVTTDAEGVKIVK